MTSRPTLTALTLALALFGVAGCGGPTSTQGAGEPPGAGTLEPLTTQGGGGAAQPSADETLVEVTSTIAGSAVAGNSGGVGEGQTDSLSEVVRRDDGSCVGWKGPDDGGAWTEGAVSGAPITVLDASRKVIGRGTLGRSRYEDVSGDEGGQWMCTFDFTATVQGPVPEVFWIQVKGLAPWPASPDPASPGRYAASVSTVASTARIDTCRDSLPDSVGSWVPVWGQYWSDALTSLCANGLRIAKIERPCRPPTLGSDRVVAVVSATDPTVVYEDGSGVHVADPPDLAPGTTVVVRVVTGQPCG